MMMMMRRRRMTTIANTYAGADAFYCWSGAATVLVPAALSLPPRMLPSFLLLCLSLAGSIIHHNGPPVSLPSIRPCVR